MRSDFFFFFFLVYADGFWVYVFEVAIQKGKKNKKKGTKERKKQQARRIFFYMHGTSAR